MDELTASDQSGTGFLPGLVVGGIVGAFLTLLVIGEKDEEVRKTVKKRALEAIKNLPGLISHFEKKTAEVTQKVVESVEDGVIKKPPDESNHITLLQERGRTAARRFFHRSAKK